MCVQVIEGKILTTWVESLFNLGLVAALGWLCGLGLTLVLAAIKKPMDYVFVTSLVITCYRN